MFLVAGCGDDGGVQPTPDAAVAPDAAQAGTLDKAVSFLGGVDALQGMSGFLIDTSGRRLTTGENFSINDPAAEISTFDTVISHDIAGDSMRYDYERNVTFLGGLPFAYAAILNQDLGYIEGLESIFGAADHAMLSTRWAAIREEHTLLHPQLLIIDVLNGARGAVEAGEQDVGGTTYEILEVDNFVDPIRLFVNTETGEIGLARAKANEFTHRDVELTVTYTDWQPADGVMFPNGIQIQQRPCMAGGGGGGGGCGGGGGGGGGADLLYEETRRAVQLNPAFDPGTFALPPADPAPEFIQADAEFGAINHLFFNEFAALGISLDFRQEFVQLVEITPGIHHAIGGSHNSLIIEQDNGLVVAEAPNYPERSDAILAALALRFPGKPVTHVIASHYHYDHTGGLRSFVAAGAAVVVHEASLSFYEDMFAAPSTVSPDALSANPQPATIITVNAAAPVILNDTNHTVQISELANPHAEDMLLIQAEFGANRVFFESDLYNPGNGGSTLALPFAQALLAAINAFGPTGADIIAGGHGAFASFTELQMFLNPGLQGR